jgi:hypothetical protein
MANASYIFNLFAIIFKGGKRLNCTLSDANIDALCLQFRVVFVLWDGAFSLARTINPTEMDIKTYRMYVNAAAKGSKDLRCTITPKVHLMLEQVEWQMRNIWGVSATKWKIGPSDCIKMGSKIGSYIVRCRTLSFAQSCEGKHALAICIRM